MNIKLKKENQADLHASKTKQILNYKTKSLTFISKSKF